VPGAAARPAPSVLLVPRWVAARAEAIPVKTGDAHERLSALYGGRLELRKARGIRLSMQLPGSPHTATK